MPTVQTGQLTVAGTGHRLGDKLGGYEKEIEDELYRVALRWLRRNPRVTKVISGMAIGWDMALARAAIKLGIPLLAAVPFEGQERFWPEATQKRYRRILKKAAEVVIVCEGEYAAWKMQRRNEWMVDHCDEILALWDGSKGGTRNCILYAKHVKKPISNVWSDWITRKAA